MGRAERMNDKSMTFVGHLGGSEITSAGEGTRELEWAPNVRVRVNKIYLDILCRCPANYLRKLPAPKSRYKLPHRRQATLISENFCGNDGSMIKDEDTTTGHIPSTRPSIKFWARPCTRLIARLDPIGLASKSEAMDPVSTALCLLILLR